MGLGFGVGAGKVWEWLGFDERDMKGGREREGVEDGWDGI